MYKPGDSVVVENYEWHEGDEGRNPNGAKGVVTGDNKPGEWLIEVELNDPLHEPYEDRGDSKWLFLAEEIRPA